MKLIRDKISFVSAQTHPADDAEYQSALDKKLQEELDEYLESHEIIELADLAEVILAICEFHHLSQKEFDIMRLNKKKEKGGFAQRLILE